MPAAAIVTTGNVHYTEHVHDTQSIARLRAGRIISALPALFLIFDSLIKLANIPAVAEAQSQLGIPLNLTLTIGTLELACVLLYVFPRTSILGAVMLTGYLGGATSIQLRVGNPLLTHLLFPAYVGMLLWGGLYLRDKRVRASISGLWR